MATTIPEQGPRTPMKRSTDSNLVGRVLLLIVLIGLSTAAVWGARRMINERSANQDSKKLTYQVTRGDLLVTVTEDGNVESASNSDIKCQVAGGSSILWIVPDGSNVKKGDKLVELDASALDEQINQQRITYEKARSAKIQAEKNLDVARLAVREYLEGTFKQEKQDADAQITISLENLRSAENALQHAERMFRKGYVSSLELEGQRFAVERSQLELDSARTAKDVLVNFTKAKMLQDLESQRDTAEAQMKSETAAFRLEEIRLKRLEDQLQQCTIHAGQDGMVVYANERSRFGQQQSTIEEGATVRERQTILRLPDLSQMQVKVNVHESKVDQLELGMRAQIRILDRELTGEVTSIANQPEPTGFFSANVKEYATRVRIDGQPDNLRPGMTAEVEILVANLTDTLSLPVAAIVEQQGRYFAWVELPDGSTERRDLVLGLSDDKFVEVKDGVAEGETVLLNPRAVVPEARELLNAADTKNNGSANGAARFGTSTKPSGDEDQASSPPSKDESKRPPRGSGDDSEERSRPESGGRSAGSVGDFINRLDQDGDGKLSKEEAPSFIKPHFDSLDSSGDGLVDSKEMETARKRFQGGGGRPPSSGNP